MEEARELTAVIITNSFIAEKIGKLPKYPFVVIFFAFALPAIYLLFSDTAYRTYFFASSSELKELLYLSVTILMGIGLLSILMVPISYLMGILTDSLRSSYEISQRNVLDDVQSIRRKIEAEKDEEAKLRLKEQEKELRSLLLEFNLEGLREKSGELSADWREALLLSRSRLMSESKRLEARSSGNLRLGMFISVFTVIILIILIFDLKNEKTPNDWFEFIAIYGPRFTLIFIVQLLASFFLKMYLGNEKDIKRNKNEITNLELRLAGGMMAENSSSVKAKLAQALISEERNFVINKKEKEISTKKDPELDSSLKLIKSIIKDLKPS